MDTVANTDNLHSFAGQPEIGGEHFLMIAAADRDLDWDRARERLSKLTDAQMDEALAAAAIHGGYDKEDLTPSETRSEVGEILEMVEVNVFNSPGIEFPLRKVMKAPAGEWLSDLHALLFSLAQFGLLQAAGVEVLGTNTPAISPENPVDYWPPEGLSPIWRPF